VLRELPTKIEFLLIDAPGGLRRETVAALRSGREVLLVAVPEIATVSNVMKTRLIAEFLGLTPIGIVLNRVRREEFELTRDEIKHIMDLPVLAEIPEDEEVKKALNQGKILVQASPRSPASKAIEGLARKLAKMRVR
jgi:MinD-like ATPase involved in chromosome partitioning or flagellar assembly